MDDEGASKVTRAGLRLAEIPDPVALLEGLFAHAPVAFQIYRADGHCALVNQAFRDLFGSEPPPEYNVLRDEIAAARGVLDLIHRAFAGETVTIPPIWYDARELRQVSVAEGRRVAIGPTFFPLRDRAGSVAYVAIAFNDVTAEMEARQQAESGRLRAEAAGDRMAFLAKASALLNESLDYERTLQDVARLMVPDIADVCSVLLLDDGGEGVHAGLRRVAAAGADPETGERLRHLGTEPLPAGVVDPVTQVIRSGEVRLLSDAGSWLRGAVGAGSAYRETMDAMGMVSAMIVPLRAREQVIGVINLATTAVSSRRYGEEDVAFGRALGERAGLAIANARLHGAQRRAAERFRTLARASEALAASAGAAAAGELFTRVVAEELGDACAISVLSDDGGLIVPLAMHNRDRGSADEATRLLSAHPMRVADSLSGRVLTGGRTVLLGGGDPARLRDSVMPEFRRYVEQFPLRSVLMAPIRLGDRPLGLMTLVRQQDGRPYDADDQSLVEDLAARFALALVRARESQALQREQQRAEEANRSKDEFLAMLGHELRNPLSPILTALELMRLRHGDAVARERDVIDRQVRHMVRLVDDLLDVSRITRGKTTLRRQPVEIAVVVAKAIEVASPMLEQRGHRLMTDVAPHGLIVDGDTERLAQVVANLLTNAAKYTEPGGQITVRAARDGGDTVTVSVADTGVGIDPELLPNVFDLFVQGHRAIDRAEGGLGLGLTIVRSLTELHGGTVQARSDGPGRGSEFLISLPLAPASVTAAIAAPPSPAATAATAGAARVLIVDDNRDAAELLAEALQPAGYDTRVALDGPAALAAAPAFAPAIALLDIGLPLMDGYELARRLRELPGLRAVKLVAITGYGQAADRARAIEAGFDAHMVKPVEVDSVLATIERLLAQPAVSGG